MMLSRNVDHFRSAEAIRGPLHLRCPRSKPIISSIVGRCPTANSTEQKRLFALSLEVLCKWWHLRSWQWVLLRVQASDQHHNRWQHHNCWQHHFDHAANDTIFCNFAVNFLFWLINLCLLMCIHLGKCLLIEMCMRKRTRQTPITGWVPGAAWW